MPTPPTEAIEAFEIEIKKWRSGDGTRHLAAVYTKDRAALRKVLSLFRRGKLVEAYQQAADLDTIVRDVIPDRAWRIMTEARNLDRSLAEVK